jgi:diadenosine tetraphosphate (Ap4A) HIT family hydrolase
MTVAGCLLCETDGGLLIYKNEQLRVIQAVEAGFPAFYRVVWDAHVAEFSDLSNEERNACMNTVVTIEKTLREQLQPTKINLAALGNAVPHLHWHVIARFDWDSHFPGSVWAAPQRAADANKLAQLALQCEQVNRVLAAKLSV